MTIDGGTFARAAVGRWTTVVGDADGTILSGEKAGGFVGATLGLFAYAAP